MKWDGMMQVGDAVRMKSGSPDIGLVVGIEQPKLAIWVRILWPDMGLAVEKKRDLEVINESR